MRHITQGLVLSGLAHAEQYLACARCRPLHWTEVCTFVASIAEWLRSTRPTRTPIIRFPLFHMSILRVRTPEAIAASGTLSSVWCGIGVVHGGHRRVGGHTPSGHSCHHRLKKAFAVKEYEQRNPKLHFFFFGFVEET